MQFQENSHRLIYVNYLTSRKYICVLMYYIYKKCLKITTNTSITQSKLVECIFDRARKFYIRRNNSKVDSIETAHIIAHLLP